MRLRFSFLLPFCMRWAQTPMNYYVARDGESFGPYGEAQAKEYLRTGVFTGDDLVCREGEENWLALGALFSHDATSIKSSPSPAEATSEPAPSASGVQATTPGVSLLKIFLTVFLAVVLGGVLLAVWSSLPKGASPRPLVLPSASVASANAAANGKKGQIQGGIFIATKEGTSYKLGAVEVRLYPRDVLENHLNRKKQERARETTRLTPLVEAANADFQTAKNKAMGAQHEYLALRYDDPTRDWWLDSSRKADSAQDEAFTKYLALLTESNHYRGGAFLFSGLPAASTVTMTDADGKFAVEVPTTGTYALAAKAQRRVGSDTERYYWFVGVSMDDAIQKAVMLTNNNLTTTALADSLASSMDVE